MWGILLARNVSHIGILIMKNESELIKKAIKLIQDFLERNGYSTTLEKRSRDNFDGVLSLPDMQLKLFLDVKKNFFASDFPRLLPIKNQLNTNRILIVVTEKLTKGTFDACIDKDIFIIDSYGNGRFRAGKCFYERFVPSESANKPRISGTPFSAKATRLVRAFLATPNKTWTQSELAKAIDISQSYASKQLALLKSKGYISFIADVFKLEEPERLLEEWQTHYRFDRHQKRQYALSFNTYENGIERLDKELHELGITFAFTGWSGSHLRAPYGTSNQLMAYVNAFPEEHQQSGLFPVKDIGNVILYLPQDEGVFQFKQELKGLPVVSDSQLYLDLKQMPGRASEQAEVLKDKYLKFEE
jgi:transcriptional regulator with AbiEi antitoxin domain of type IV toxin-antitoxin system